MVVDLTHSANVSITHTKRVCAMNRRRNPAEMVGRNCFFGRNLDHAAECRYSVFISYRVRSEAVLAKLLFDHLANSVTPAGHRVRPYLDQVPRASLGTLSSRTDVSIEVERESSLLTTYWSESTISSR